MHYIKVLPGSELGIFLFYVMYIIYNLHYGISYLYAHCHDRFFEINQSVVNKHAPVHGNNKPFMNKAYSKAIMQKTHFRNKFFKKT